MANAHIYIDNSNVYAEGCRVSAVNKKLSGIKDMHEAQVRQITDFGWHLEYPELYKIVLSFGITIGCANLWGSPPPSDPFWKYIESQGFTVINYDKNAAGKEKKIDTAIAYQISKDSFSGKIDKANDKIYLFAGDTDYVPVVKDLVAEGFSVNVVFWDHAGLELKKVASSFVSLNPHFSVLTH